MNAAELETIKTRAKEGGHYSEWLHVHKLIAEVERLPVREEEMSDEQRKALARFLQDMKKWKAAKKELPILDRDIALLEEILK